jgi:SAM-dependent methyltransferase
MVATVLFRRDYLVAVNGFDETLRRCEDLDLYLRMTQRYPIASHPTVIAEYRKHGQNMSNNYVEQLKTVLGILDGHEARIATDPPTRAALREGRAHIRTFYVPRMLDAATVRWRTHHNTEILMQDLLHAARWSPLYTMRRLLGVLRRRAFKVFPSPLQGWIQRIRGRLYRIPIGSVRFGDLKRSSPIGHGFGLDRGTPVDRYYIESFLAQNADDICGRVLEIGDNSYTVRFGDARVSQSDILHVDATNARATFIGDLAQPGVLPEGVFDCIVITQTLHLVYDMPAAVRTLYRALKPGGVLLMTTPGISQVDRGEWGPTWYWSLTEAAARRLLEDRFGPNAVTVRTHGNVFAATAFLYALATEELNISDLDADDKNYPVIVTARAIKQKDA